MSGYFKVDPWNVIEEGFDAAHRLDAEAVFSLANGSMGVRGYFEEGYGGGSSGGCYVDGVWEKKVLPPFWCKGLAHSECYPAKGTDWLRAEITLDGETLDLAVCKFHGFKRALDMKTGVLRREFVWELASGKLLKLTFLRFVSMEEPDLGCQRITFEPLNFDGAVEVRDRATLDGRSFDAALEANIAHWARFWETSDIEIEGDPEAQQGVRFCVFNLHQAFPGERRSWETETYLLPFYLFTDPGAARRLLEFRYQHLPEAMERAAEVGCAGALYPLSTLDGTESCTWWEHSMLQIHVSAAVAYGIWHYVHVTGDRDFLDARGREMLVQICRYYASRGRWGQETGKFGFFGVMGPDEFHMMVNNDCYTNLMVKKAFAYTLQVADEAEARAWRAMAENMEIPLDARTGLYEQHDAFFDMPHIDIKTIPPGQFPLEEHWAYDRIFRYDMIRQPDVLPLLLFFSREHSLEAKRVNYEYYEPRCVHESPFSPAIHSILAAELGKSEQARAYARLSYQLGPYNAGAWLNTVYGFAGLRSDGETLTFNPALPENWASLRFALRYRGKRIEVKLSRDSVSISEGEKT